MLLLKKISFHQRKIIVAFLVSQRLAILLIDCMTTVLINCAFNFNPYFDQAHIILFKLLLDRQKLSKLKQVLGKTIVKQTNYCIDSISMDAFGFKFGSILLKVELNI